MPKVSSNAGKHPYLRTNEREYENLFSHLKTESGGIPISEISNPSFKVDVETEYVDKNNQSIRFRDTLIFQKREYVVDFRDEKWVMIDASNPKKMEILGKKAHLTVLSKRYN